MAWVFLLPIADHHGRFRWDKEELHLKIVRRGLPLMRWLDDLWREGVITKYEEDGQIYGRFAPYLTGWPKSQTKTSRLPRPTPENIIRRPPKVSVKLKEKPQPTPEPASSVPAPASPTPKDIELPSWMDDSLLPVWRYYIEHVDDPDPMEFASEYGTWKKRMEA